MHLAGRKGHWSDGTDGGLMARARSAVQADSTNSTAVYQGNKAEVRDLYDVKGTRAAPTRARHGPSP